MKIDLSRGCRSKKSSQKQWIDFVNDGKYFTITTDAINILDSFITIFATPT